MEVFNLASRMVNNCYKRSMGHYARRLILQVVSIILLSQACTSESLSLFFRHVPIVAPYSGSIGCFSGRVDICLAIA